MGALRSKAASMGLDADVLAHISGCEITFEPREF